MKWDSGPEESEQQIIIVMSAGPLLCFCVQTLDHRPVFTFYVIRQSEAMSSLTSSTGNFSFSPSLNLRTIYNVFVFTVMVFKKSTVDEMKREEKVQTLETVRSQWVSRSAASKQLLLLLLLCYCPGWWWAHIYSQLMFKAMSWSISEQYLNLKYFFKYFMSEPV